MRNAVVWLATLTLLFGFFQAIMGGVVATHCFGITVGSFIMFIKFQDDQITIDSLTTLNNRYALDNYLTDKLKDYSSGSRRQQVLYLLMMDLNNFKHVNDTYGHQEGDKMLRDVANKLKGLGAIYKSNLFLARYAGDEYAAVFEAMDYKTVRKLAKDIKDCVAEVSIDDFRLGISVGIAAYAGDSMSQETLISIADKALYIDKHSVKDPKLED
jgi:diguanylate cyclase (GGDEF)-like protein